MITARSPFQIFKGEGNSASSVTVFNGLPPEISLPYRIEAAEETLLASLSYIESNTEEKGKYAVSILHSAVTYLSLIASYLPLQSRDGSLKKISLNTDAVMRCVTHFGAEKEELTEKFKQAAMTSKDSPLLVVSELESQLKDLEKDVRQHAKETGEKMEILKKVAPAEIRRSLSPPIAVDVNDIADNKSEKGSQIEGQTTTEEITTTGTSAGVKRSRSRKSQSKKEGDAAVETDGGNVKKRKKVPTADRPKKSMLSLVFGRQRALTPAEKKVVNGLENIIEILAHVYANKYNDLSNIFDELLQQVAPLESIIEKEKQAFKSNPPPEDDKKAVEPFYHISSIMPITTAIANAARTFHEDEECRIEFDEDLIHPIAHACLNAINLVEGYVTAPFKEPTEEEIAKKAEARKAAKEKREEAQQKIIERARQKEENIKKREAEQRRLREQLGEDDEENKVEDTQIENPSVLGYVQYDKELKLETQENYEKALFIWTMITSIPETLKLSKIPFKTFLKGIEEEDESVNGLMEEVVNALLQISMEHVRVSSPNTPKVNTRGKTWFESLKEFVAVASGNKKTRAPRKVKEPSSDDFSSDEDDSSSSSDSRSSAEEEEEEEEEGEEEEEEKTKAKKEEEKDEKEKKVIKKEEENQEGKTEAAEGAAQETKEAEQVSGFDKEMKETMETINELRHLASWGNVDLQDRLNLLLFCVNETLASDVVQDDADVVSKSQEEKKSALDKKITSIREDAEKELKSMMKTLQSAKVGPGRRGKRSRAAAEGEDKANDDEDAEYEEAKETDFETEKNKILTQAEKKKKDAFIEYFSEIDSPEKGVIIEPLGMDRYKRLYWRFPLERCLRVQTTDQTNPLFPLLPMPENLKQSSPVGHRLLLDDGEEPKKGKANSSGEEAAEVQKVWGIIPGDYVADFAKSLDERGEREAVLRKQLEALIPHLDTIEEQHETRLTRARAHTFGYVNTLKEYF